MNRLNLNKEYSLKLGEAEPINSIYLGIKKFKRNSYKHVFLVHPFINNHFIDYRFYLGKINKTTLKENIVHIKEPTFKKVNILEKGFLEHLIEKLENQ